MATVTIAGGTGMIGTQLSKLLAESGHTVYILSRSPGESEHSNIHFSIWDIEKNHIDEKVIENTDVLINLAGANIGEGRWTDKRKKIIVESRVRSNEFLSTCVNILPHRISKFISASANGYYGHRPGVKVDERSGPGNGFLSEVCMKWENAVKIVKPDIGVYFMRMGVILANSGGAFPKMKAGLPFVVPYFGNGKQVMSWIHITDICGVYKFFIENTVDPGIYNINSPNTVSSKKMAKTISSSGPGIGLVLPVPLALLQLALGEMATTVSDSIDVSSDKLIRSGYSFQYPEIESAIQQLFGQSK